MKKSKHIEYIIGIDEVGRGALAGPVTVVAILLPRNFQKNIRVNPLLLKKYPRQSASIKLRDSKKLSPKQREVWFQYITRIKRGSQIKVRIARGSKSRRVDQLLLYTTASVSSKVIDRINITQAANLAATRALEKLISNSQFPISKRFLTKVYLDGGLYLNKNIRVNPRISVSTIIKGDEKIPAIMLASIVAKVRRDKMMVKLHKKYPQYAFDRHKGYGTKKHIKAIRKFGPSPIHRRTFKIKI